MSTLELEHIKHSSSSSNNLSVHSDGSLSLNGNLGVGTTTGSESLNTTGNFRFQTTNTVRIEYLNTTGAYALGTTGGAAIGFNRPAAGDDEIFFETHNGGVSHAERMRINKDGYVTMPSQPSFMAYGSWNYQASTYIWQGFATVDHNIGSHWNNSIGRFTAPVAGRYMIYATAHHSAVGSYHLWAFLKNGSLGGGNWVQSYDANGGNDTTSKTQVWNLAAGDYLEVASNATYANGYLGGYVTVGGHLVG
ncbi:MAG: hypothetical protein CMH04_00830 [Marinovum sp.]|nr:hypothetical protein [Marinovum sp.]|tara:strand:+ start:75 stop:821 length:747 start_codon:yes stop_codon:yes gene_type:complete